MIIFPYTYTFNIFLGTRVHQKAILHHYLFTNKHSSSHTVWCKNNSFSKSFANSRKNCCTLSITKYTEVSFMPQWYRFLHYFSLLLEFVSLVNPSRADFFAPWGMESCAMFIFMCLPTFIFLVLTKKLWGFRKTSVYHRKIVIQANTIAVSLE